MARRKKKNQGEGGAAWLVTFSDLMTLLLTFFVLLLSMSTMDVTIITKITAFTRSASPIAISGDGKLPERLQVAVSLITDPENVLEKKDRIKDLLFPEDVLPADMSTSDLENNLQILEHPEGVVIVLTEGVLFQPGEYALNHKGLAIMAQLVPVVHAVNSDVNVSGHTDSTIRTNPDNDTLSFLRAKTILEQFVQGQVRQNRFSVSGYGPDKPMASNATEEGRRQNRRVEILLKTTPRIGGYL